MASGFEGFKRIEEPSAAPTAAPSLFSEFRKVEEAKTPETYGQQQYAEDEAKVAAERGLVPDSVKAAAYSAANAALFNIPSHVVARIEATMEGTPYFEQYKKQKDYEAALSRQNPAASTTGTVLGTVGSIFVPMGALGRAATLTEAAKKGVLVGGLTSGASSAIEEADLSVKTALDTAVGATLGGTLAPAAGKLAQYFSKRPEAFVPDASGNLVPTPETKAAIESAFGRSLSPEEIGTFQKELINIANTKKGVSPEVVKEAVLTAEGVPVSRELVTGVTSGGESATAAKSAREAGQDILRQRAAALTEPQTTLGETVEDIFSAAATKRDVAKKQLEESAAMPGVFKPSMRWIKKETPPGEPEVFTLTPYSIKDLVIPEVRGALKQRPETNINFNNVTNYPVSTQAMKFLQEGIGANNLPLNEPSTFRNVYEVRKQLSAMFPGAQGHDRVVLNTIIDGYDNFLQRAITENLFTGNGSKAIDAATKGRADWKAFKRDFFSDKSAEDKVMSSVMQKLIGPDGNLLQNLDEGAKQAAYGVLNSAMLNKKMSMALYQRLEKTLPADAMERVNANIRNVALDVQGDLSKLPKKIDEFLKPENRGIALRAFGAKANDPASQSQAAQSLAELRRLKRAVELVQSKPQFTPEEQQGRIRQIVNRMARPLTAAIFGAPHGPIVTTLAVGAAELAGEGGQAIRAARKIAEERAGAPAVPKAQPSFRTPIPTSAEAPFFPEYETEAGYGPPTGAPRTQRKAGGRVTTASQLIASVERAKQKVNNTTKPLMKASDDHIAHALAIANRHLED